MREHVTVAAATNSEVREQLNRAIRQEQKHVIRARRAANRRAWLAECWKAFVTIGAVVAIVDFSLRLFGVFP